MSLEQLWNGWRAEYIGTANSNSADPSQSVFTSILNSGLSDEETFIVHRSTTCFVILNSYPYASGHLLVLPYREVAESGVAITASTHGRAIIASDLAPFLEATEDGRLGLHFRNGDIFDIARVMKLVMTLESELDEMGSQAKVKILRERDPMEIGIKMRDLYLKVLS